MNKTKRIEKKLKIIIDTNVYISALCFKSKGLKKLITCISKTHNILFSPDLIHEIFINFKRYQASKSAKKTIKDIILHSKIISPIISIDFENDPKDSFILELAETCKAHYIITGDKKHLLILKKWKTTKIVSPKEFLEDLQLK